jgi:hypothetical protein
MSTSSGIALAISGFALGFALATLLSILIRR